MSSDCVRLLSDRRLQHDLHGRHDRPAKASCSAITVVTMTQLISTCWQLPRTFGSGDDFPPQPLPSYCRGGTVVSRASPDAFYPRRAAPITLTFAVPTMIYALLDHPDQDR
jgi:hypothetical protein